MKTVAIKSGLVIIQASEDGNAIFLLARKRTLKSGARKYTIQGEIKIKGMAAFKEDIFNDYIHSDSDKEFGLNYLVQVRLAYQDETYEIDYARKGEVLKTGGYYNGVLTKASVYGMDEIVYTGYDEIAYGVSEVEWIQQVVIGYNYGPEYYEMFEEVVKRSTEYNCVTDLGLAGFELRRMYGEIKETRVKEALKLEPEWNVTVGRTGFELTDENGELILNLLSCTSLFSDLKIIREFYEQWGSVSLETRKEVLNEWVAQNTKRFSPEKELYGLMMNLK